MTMELTWKFTIYSCEGICIFGVKVIYINACAADEQTQYRASFKLFYVIL